MTVLTQASAFHMNLNKQASWYEVRQTGPLVDNCLIEIHIYNFKALENYIVSPFFSPSPDKQRGIEEKTLANIELDPEADWTAAWEKNLQRQTLYNNIVKEVFNSFTRMLGWHLISVVSTWLQ